MEACVLCGKGLGDKEKVVNVQRKGIETIIHHSETRHKDKVGAKLRGKDQVRVHSECRKVYTNPKRKWTVQLTEASTSSPVKSPKPERKLRQKKTFSFRKNCFLCGNEASVSTKLPLKYRPEVHKVMSGDGELQRTILRIADERKDEWAETVLTRIRTVDLFAEDAVYHQSCFNKFGKIPAESAKQRKGVGRPADTFRIKAFEDLCLFLEDNEDCQFSLSFLVKKMESLLPVGAEPYSLPFLKQKLSETFKDRVAFTSIKGNVTIVTFQDTVGKLLYGNWYKERKADETEERMRVIEAAAGILREDIRSMVFDLEDYPTFDPDQLADKALIPRTLQRFLEIIVQSKGDAVSLEKKRNALAQTLILACRPRSFLSPILLALGITLKRRFGSRLLIDIMHRLGFCVSYDEVLRYEKSTIVHGESSHILPADSSFIQFSFDNADVNVRTLDGHGTFHAMGGVQMSTPADPHDAGTPVPRITKEVPTADQIAKVGRIPISWYKKPSLHPLKKVKLCDLSSIHEPVSLRTALAIDTVWMTRKLLSINPTASWNGFMRSIYEDSITGNFSLSSVKVLPFINLNSTDMSTILSALSFASSQCRRQNKGLCMVTFDQPLFIRAKEVCENPAYKCDLANVIVRLGGFHTLMSFLGSVGYIMEGSGLEECLATIYASNSIKHVFSGHAFTRALRAHFLCYEALYQLIMEKVKVEDSLLQQALSKMRECLSVPELPTLALSTFEEVNALQDRMSFILSKIKDKSKTAELWVQYLQLVNIVRWFIRAERLGDWDLHLYSVKCMLPYFHSSGHLNYAKSAHLYLQDMSNICSRLSAEEFSRFKESGFFTIRRTHKMWAGVWTDMVIEQDLMRAMKVSGGLTRGRGLAESTLANWVLTMPRCVHVCNALEQFSGVAALTSEQHVELRPSRMQRDAQDCKKILDWLRTHSPLEVQERLVSVATGLVGDEKIDCYKAEEIGLKGVRKLSGQVFSDIKLKRNDRVLNMASIKNTVVVRNSSVPVNPQQLFLRISCVMQTQEDLLDYFKYELAPYPPSLFDEVSLRKGTKSNLASIFESLSPCTTTLPKEPSFVLDGGHLLHAVPWQRATTYGTIITSYIDYVLQNYGDKCVVVFDGYDDPNSTKTAEHVRRATTAVSANIELTKDMSVTTTQAAFLANNTNKTKLIGFLCDGFKSKGISVVQAMSDADTIIVNTALQRAQYSSSVVVIGTDTDVLAMLTARAHTRSRIQFLHPATAGRARKCYNISDIQNKMSRDLKESILFLHGMTGCDTTSSLYGKGKRTAFSLLKKSAQLRADALRFNVPNASRDEIIAAGERFISALYTNGKPENLDQLRHKLYKRTIKRQPVTASFNLATLPPTSAAAKHHSLRVYLQIQEWLGNNLDPKDWGWQQGEHMLVPKTTDLPPAPEQLLNMIACNCRGQCGARCPCLLAGLDCTVMCAGHFCPEANCGNVHNQFAEDDNIDEDIRSDTEN